MTYKTQHIPLTQTLQRPGLAMTPTSITIHSTANLTSTAQNERDNLARVNNDRQASFHIVIDERQAIECIPLTETAWHAGDGRKAGGGNMASIGIEICESGDREKTLRHAVEATAYILSKYGWGVDRLKQHFDWSGKNCPRILRDTDRWGWFVDEVKALLGGTPILGKPTATETQAFDWAMSKGATAVFGSNSAWYWALATLLGIDPVAAYAQYAKETGFGRFGGVLDASFCNPCGMKNSQGGSDTDPSAHKRFRNWEQGIQAQLDHLALYAGADGYPKATTGDPRHFPYLLGKCKTVESLGGCWAPSSEYGNGIVKMMREIQAMPVEIKPTPPPVDWTAKYVEWGVANGIMDGTRLDEPATRAEVLKMIYEAVHAG